MRRLLSLAAAGAAAATLAFAPGASAECIEQTLEFGPYADPVVITFCPFD